MNTTAISLSPQKAFGPVLDWMMEQCKNPIGPALDRGRDAVWTANVGRYAAQAPTEALATRRCIALSQLGYMVDVPIDVALAGLTAPVAARFAQLVNEYYLTCQFGEELYEAMLKANAVEPDKSICHTHDHCDANVFMSSAIEDITARDPAGEDLIDDPAMLRLWNESWNMAKRVYLADLDKAAVVIYESLFDCPQAGLSETERRCASPVDASSFGETQASALDEASSRVAMSLSVEDKWKELAVRRHVYFMGDDDGDAVAFYDDLVRADENPALVAQVFASHEAGIDDAFQACTEPEVARHIESLSYGMQQTARQDAQSADPMVKMIGELRDYLVEIQSGRLDGSEPALVDLLKESGDFLDDAQPDLALDRVVAPERQREG